jgi:excisionase family DNA binding protein
MAVELLTTAEAAERCGMSAKTIARWADAGRLRIAAKAGDTRLFDPADVDALAAERVAKIEEKLAALKAASA